jgi:hypothetical protein
MTDTPYRFRWEKDFRAAAKLSGEKLGGTTVAVGFVLATYANIDGSSIRPSLETVADGLGMSRSAVDKAVARLRDEQWVIRERDNRLSGKPSEYRLNIPQKFRTPPSPETEGMEPARKGHSPTSKGFVAGDEQVRSGLQTTRPGTMPGTTTETTTGEPLQEYQNNPWAGLDNPAKLAATAVNTLRKESGEETAPADNVWEWTDTELDWLERRHLSGEELWPYEQDALAVKRPWLSLPPSFD